MTAVRGSSFFMERLLPFNATLEGAELYSKYHNTTKSIFPAYLEEIRGMAEGAHLTYSEVCQLSQNVSWGRYKTSTVEFEWMFGPSCAIKSNTISPRKALTPR